MRLKRFEEDYIHYNYKREKTPIQNNDSVNNMINEQVNIIIDEKIEILANIYSNWNDNLSEKYKSIKELYSLSPSELKKIKEIYIDEMEIPNKNIENTILKEKLENTKLELIEKYGNNEAIKDINIFENNIKIDLLCDTDIEKSVTEYNGINIIYNKICEIPLNESINNTQINNDDLDYDELITEQSIYMNQYLSNILTKN